ncbi:MAG: hypothetical protein HY306_05685 [Nitrosomonadales bacterium]|nr:hypothetical protein [Nitrosomonadales bacterium]
MPITSLAAIASYLLMLAAYFLPRQRWLHIPAMAAIMLFDVGLPIYLYTHRNWWHRLIEQQDILSFLVWMHFGLIVAIYALDILQIQSARKILRGIKEARAEHHGQGKALLVIRGLVILTGAILANPE